MSYPDNKVIDGIKTAWFFDETGHGQVNVFPFEKKATACVAITVYRFTSIMSGKLEKARVNWPAIGATDTETARLFAKGLEVACKIAEDLDTETKK